MANSFFTTIAMVSFCFATNALAEEIELDWNSIELGFFEKTNSVGEVLHGLTVYVPGNRVASEDDFYEIIPDFCSTRFAELLEYSMQLEGAPEVSFVELQIDFYGPKIGENETYVARSATLDLDNGKCSL